MAELEYEKLTEEDGYLVYDRKNERYISWIHGMGELPCGLGKWKRILERDNQKYMVIYSAMLPMFQEIAQNDPLFISDGYLGGKNHDGDGKGKRYVEKCVMGYLAKKKDEEKMEGLFSRVKSLENKVNDLILLMKKLV
jgi:hypothetical protein